MSRKKIVAGVIAVALCMASLSSVIPSWAAGSGGEKSLKFTADPDGTQRRRNLFPNVVVRTHENQEVRFYDDLIKGKTVLINFIYTTCEDGICPPMTQNLVQVQELLGDRVGRDIFMYSISLDPVHDTPEVLKSYAELFGVKPGWLFLTGKEEDIEIIRQSLGFVNSDPEADKIKSQHIGMIKYGIEPLERWGACPALTNPKWIPRILTFMDPKGDRPRGDERF